MTTPPNYEEQDSLNMSDVSDVSNIPAKSNAHLLRWCALLICIVTLFALSAGAVWGKYAQDLSATTELKVTISDYTINKTKMQTVIKSLSTKPTSIKYVTGESVPAGLTNLATTTVLSSATAGIQEDDGSMIGVFQDGTTLYIAPMNAPAESDSTGVAATAANNNYVMHTPTDASTFLDLTTMGYTDDTYDSITELDLSNLDTSKTTDMSRMFFLCRGVTSIDVSGFDTSKVTNMSDMFYYMAGLTEMDVSNFDTSKVTNMSFMFQRCENLTTLKGLTNFDTEHVTNMQSMFARANNIPKLDLSAFNTGQVTTMYNMFYNCNKLAEITLGENFDFKGTDGYLPEPSSTYIDGATGKWKDTSTDITYTPSDLATFHNTSTSARTYVADVNLTTYTISSSSLWTALTNLASSKPTTLKFVKGSEVPSGLTSKASIQDTDTDSGEIGVYVSGSTIYIAPTDRSDSTSSIYAPADSNQLLASSKTGLGSYLTEIDCSNLNTSNVTNMRYIFYNNSVLTKLNISSLNTKKAVNMCSLFRGCSKLTSIDVSSLSTESATDISYMFADCSTLTSADLSNFDTSKVTSLVQFFYGCSSLSSVNLTSFNTESVKVMYWMFTSCSSLTALDLSSFNTKNVTDTSYMFQNCSNLKKIYASSDFVTTNISDSNSFDMFRDCNSLVGGNGFKYSSSYVTKTYARIDTASTPGYFTAKN